MLEKILSEIENKKNLKLFVIQFIKKKNTKRSCNKYLLRDERNLIYLLEVGETKIENFYIQNNIRNLKKFKSLGINASFNSPLYYNFENSSSSYVLYNYFKKFTYSNDLEPVQLLLDFYEINSIDLQINENVIKKILDNFLLSWPKNYHASIKRLEEFNEYKIALSKFHTIIVSIEHGDYTKNNIINIGNRKYITDFEFCREFQPIGFDIYDYLNSINKIKCFKYKTEYIKLHKIKLNLINRINFLVDSNFSDIQIYTNFNNIDFISAWEDLYSKGSSYNTSPIWCKTWSKYFLKENLVFIISIWNHDNNLELVAPFYISKNTAFLIGTKPDLYDNFDILYKTQGNILRLFEFLFSLNLDLNFKYINSNSNVIKLLFKYLNCNNILFKSNVVDTKPKIENLNTYKFKSQIKTDIKRCHNLSQRKYNSMILFCSKENKTKLILKSFIKNHILQWRGGPFKIIRNYDSFITDISLSDLVQLSTLKLKKKIIAYHLMYKDSNGLLTSVIPSYNKKYKEISPGKILLYSILEDEKNINKTSFDFGRGGEYYKYWFANDSDILLNIKIYNRNSFYRKLLLAAKKIYTKIDRLKWIIN